MMLLQIAFKKISQLNLKALIGGSILAFFCIVALYGAFMVDDPNAYVGIPLSPPSAEHWFGTTGQGQDVFAQTVAGSTKTLTLSFIIGLAVTLIGAIIGISSAIFHSRLDQITNLLINTFLVIPGLPLAIVLASYLPSGSLSIVFVLILTGWSWNSRVIRSQALSLRSKDFVLAAIVSGESRFRLIFWEILPNMLSLLVSIFIGSTIYAMGAQVGLEFLGLGDISQVSWGTNLYWATNDAALLTESWWTFVPTGLSIALVGFALTLINFSIDELTNPSLKAEASFRKKLKNLANDSSLMTAVLPVSSRF